MHYREVCLLAFCLMAGAACVGGDAVAASPGDRSDLFVPANLEQVLLRFERGTLPKWRVRTAAEDEFQATTEIRITMNRPISLLLLSDQECRFMIPAMRVDKMLPTDRFQVAWFTAVKAGTYEVTVRVGTEQYDGKLIVERPKP